VTERVEVCAELHRADDLLRNPVDMRLSHAAVAVGVMGRRHECLPEKPAREHGNVLVQDAAEVEHPALADQGERLETLRLVHVVEHADLILGPEWGGHSDDHGVRKLG
jgi:hypothetical protein